MVGDETARSRSMLEIFSLRIRRLVRGRRFTSSADYWEERYRSGGNSGAGSYSRLAAYKAEVLNEFVTHNAIGSVVEFGVGDGAQLSLANYPEYTGIDVSRTVVQATRQRFAADPTVKILHTSEIDESYRADLALSLDVIYHLVEDSAFDIYMRQMFAAADRYAIFYASNFDSDWRDPHVKHRQFTSWVEKEIAAFELVRTVRNRYPYREKDPNNTSFADFYIYRRLTV